MTLKNATVVHAALQQRDSVAFRQSMTGTNGVYAAVVLRAAADLTTVEILKDTVQAYEEAEVAAMLAGLEAPPAFAAARDAALDLLHKAGETYDRPLPVDAPVVAL